jgi:hypothetical protein
MPPLTRAIVGGGDHGENTRGVFSCRSTVGLPLIVRAPGLWPAGRRVAKPVSLAEGTGTGPAREVSAESYSPRL